MTTPDPMQPPAELAPDATVTPTPTEPHHDVRERAGRALYEHRQATNDFPPDGYTTWDDLPEDWQDEYREAADAVLAAVSAATPAPCPERGPGYRYGDDGCRHTPAAAPDEREDWLTLAERLVADERRRQVDVEGWTPEHDREHGHENIVKAGNAYLRNDQRLWPWLGLYWKPKSEVRNLIRAGALALAALDLAPASPGALGLHRAAVALLADRLSEVAALAARPAPVVSRAEWGVRVDRPSTGEYIIPADDLAHARELRDPGESIVRREVGPWITVADAPAADDEGGQER